MIGWFTDITEADTWFSERAGADDWTTLTEEQKTKYLKTAYNRISNFSKLSIPETPTSAELEKLKYAQGEFAWYLYIHIQDEDRRKGLQYQGVKSAGIVKEQYNEDTLNEMVIPGFIYDILRSFRNDNYGIYGIELERDEEEEDIVE